MSAVNDDLYIEGRALLDRITPLATFDPNTPIGGAYWQLSNHLAIGRGDASLGGTLVSAETRNMILDEAGNFRPAYRNYIAGWITTLKTAFPVTATAIITQPATAGTLPAITGAPFLGGILDGEIFGIDKKILAAAALLYFFMGKK